MSKKYDIILFGASGFTGALVARYISAHIISENINWAIAGRDEKKLKEIQNGLTNSPDIVIADVTDKVSLHQMASKSKVLMNAVGPFNWYGKDVVKACIDNSTHYLDITGEPSFVADVYNSYYQLAVENKACVVNCCGFDSIPADYAAWLTAQKLPLNEPKSLMGYFRTNAAFSGGTLTTAIQALYMEAEKKSVKVRIKKHKDAPKLDIKIHFSKEVGGWAIPMPVVDPHIVKRSAFRLPQDYGIAVSYGQFFVRTTFIKMLKTILPVISARFLVRFKTFRKRMFDKFQPGTGPDEERRAKSQFEVVCIGKSKTAEAITIFSGGDPGYNETAKMFAQSAFTLLDKIKNNSVHYGVLTPVEAFGMDLVTRLRKEGLHIV
ncbi:MAG: saccharopine dehydrogenase NADP-binding domain-containing protein [Saprospiraceae bacterium]|nr:saccharopine dehydrogenase NADP-binding domain-containing protein [Saprospiraceae bacterium]